MIDLKLGIFQNRIFGNGETKLTLIVEYEDK